MNNRRLILILLIINIIISLEKVHARVEILESFFVEPSGKISCVFEDRQQIFVGFEEGGLAVFNSLEPSKINRLVRTSGVVMDCVKLSGNTIYLDSKIGPFVVPDGVIHDGEIVSPLVWIYGGKKLSPMQDKNGFFVVCDREIVAVTTRDGKADVEYTIGGEFIPDLRNDEIVNACETDGKFVVVLKSGKIMLLEKNASGYYLKPGASTKAPATVNDAVIDGNYIVTAGDGDNGVSCICFSEEKTGEENTVSSVLSQKLTLFKTFILVQGKWNRIFDYGDGFLIQGKNEEVIFIEKKDIRKVDGANKTEEEMELENDEEGTEGVSARKEMVFSGKKILSVHQGKVYALEKDGTVGIYGKKGKYFAHAGSVKTNEPNKDFARLKEKALFSANEFIKRNEDGSLFWKDVYLDWGVKDCAVNGKHLVTVKGDYGVKVYDTSSGAPVYVGGWSKMWTDCRKVVMEDDKITVLSQNGIHVLMLISAENKSSIFSVNGIAGKEFFTILDDGVDITSYDYSAKRGYTAPLKIVIGDVDETVKVKHGTAVVDAQKEKIKFPDELLCPVKVVGTCQLPHPGNVLCLVDNKYLIIGGGEGENLEWWDVGNPSAPVFIKRIQPAMGPPLKVTAQGRKIFIAVNIWGCGLYVYDFSDINNPVLLGNRTDLGERLASVSLVGNNAVVHVYRPKDELQILDVTDPSKMETLSVMEKARGPVAVNKNVMFCITESDADNAKITPLDKTDKEEEDESIDDLLGEKNPEPAEFQNIGAWDLSDGRNPIKLCVLRIKGAVNGIFCQDNKLFVGGMRKTGKPGAEAQTGFIEVWNISDASKPKKISRYETQRNASNINVTFCVDEKNTIYAGFNEGESARLDVIALSGSNKFEIIANKEFSGHFFGDLLAKQDKLYVTMPKECLRIYDVSAPSQPKEIGLIPAAEGWGGQIDATETAVYVTDEGGPHFAVTSVDITDPARPKVRKRQIDESFFRPSSPAVMNNELLVLVGGGPIGIYSIREEPFSPKIGSRLEIGGSTPSAGHGIRPFKDNLALVTSLYWLGKWGIVDIADSLRPKLVTTVQGTETEREHGSLSVGSFGNIIYWMGRLGPTERDNNRSVGFKLYDAVKTENPVKVSEWFYYNVSFTGLSAQSDGFLYLWVAPINDWAEPGARIFVFDIRNPVSPKFVADYPAPGITGCLAGMRVHGDFLYVVGYVEQRLMVLDVSNPEKPVEILNWRTDSAGVVWPGDFDIEKDMGVVSGGGGLAVIEVPLSSQIPLGKLTVR